MNRRSISPATATKSVIDLAPILTNGFNSNVPTHGMAPLKSKHIHGRSSNQQQAGVSSFAVKLPASHSRSSSTGLSTAVSSTNGNLLFSANTSQIYSRYHHILNTPQAMLSPEKSTSALFLSKLIKSSKVSPPIKSRKPKVLISSPELQRVFMKQTPKGGGYNLMSTLSIEQQGKKEPGEERRAKFYPSLTMRDKFSSSEDKRGISPDSIERLGKTSGVFERKTSTDVKEQGSKLFNSSTSSFGGTKMHRKVYRKKIKELGSTDDNFRNEVNLEEKKEESFVVNLQASNQLRTIEKNNIKRNLEEMDKLLDKYHDRVAAIQMLSKANIALRKDIIRKEKIKEDEKQKETEKQALDLKERMNTQVPEKYEKYKTLLSQFINNHLCDYEVLNKNYKKDNEKYLSQDPAKIGLYQNPMMVFNIATCKRKYMSASTPLKKLMSERQEV